MDIMALIDRIEELVDNGRSLPFGNSKMVDPEKVYEIIEELIRLAEFEERVSRIAEELGTTSRKVNALENMVIPDMKYTIKFIEDKLDEESMEELVRMKLIGGTR